MGWVLVVGLGWVVSFGSCGGIVSGYGRVIGINVISTCTLFLNTGATLTDMARCVSRGMSLGARGYAVRSIVRRVRGRASCLFMCSGGSISMGHAMCMGKDGASMVRLLGNVFTGASVSYGMLNGGVALSGVSGMTAEVTRRAERRGGATGNGIVSSANRPMVNTSMMRRNAAGNAIASVGNGFALGLDAPGTGVRVSFVNCGARMLTTRSNGLVTMGLISSARLLSRIIMMNCNSRGGIGVANTITAVSSGALTSEPVSGVSRNLRNLTPNMAMAGTNNRPNRSANGVLVHNLNSFGTSSPVILVSNMRNSVGIISPGSVRDVSMLGSTSSTTVCNSGTTGNMVLVAAGHKRDNGPGLACDTLFK